MWIPGRLEVDLLTLEITRELANLEKDLLISIRKGNPVIVQVDLETFGNLPNYERNQEMLRFTAIRSLLFYEGYTEVETSDGKTLTSTYTAA